jgi:AraC family transcriptional regulator
LSDNHYLARIQRGLDFVEQHLDDDLPLAAVGRAAGLSQWHFQRMFRSLTGGTLKAYIRGRRLARAAERLRTENLRVLDVALLAGFESQEAFARVFKLTFGVTPTDFRRADARTPFGGVLRLDRDMLDAARLGPTPEPELVAQPRLTLVGYRTSVYGIDSERANFGEKLPPMWRRFLADRSSVAGAIGDRCYGVIRRERDDDDRLEYFAAVAVPAADRVPPGMDVTEVPAATYARFEHRGAATAVDVTISHAYSRWLIASGRRHTYGPDLEIYDHRYHATDPSSMFVYALPVTD